MSEETTPKKKRPIIRVVVTMIGVLALIIILQNTETVETRILFATIAMPRAVLLVATFLLGVVVGLLTGFLRKRKTAK